MAVEILLQAFGQELLKYAGQALARQLHRADTAIWLHWLER
jgi:hypothetical protein